TPHYLFACSRLFYVQPRNQALRIRGNFHATTDVESLRINGEANGGNFAARQAEQSFRCAHRKTAKRFVEIEHIVGRNGVRLLHRSGLVIVEGEDRIRGCGRSLGGDGRRVEGETASEHRDER